MDDFPFFFSLGFLIERIKKSILSVFLCLVKETLVEVWENSKKLAFVYSDFHLSPISNRWFAWGEERETASSVNLFVFGRSLFLFSIPRFRSPRYQKIAYSGSLAIVSNNEPKLFCYNLLNNQSTLLLFDNDQKS